MGKRFLATLLMPLFVFSQQWNDRSHSGDGLVGISLGLLIEGQTQYPTPYFGPEVSGLYNDGAYHIIFDIYYNKLVIGLQFSDEFLYLERFENGAVWKPRGFNESFSSLTRTYWFKIGYNVISNVNVKLGVGYRSGPHKPISNGSKTVSEVAVGFNYSNPVNIYNTTQVLDKFSEIDYCLSISYPIKIYGKFGVVPELGYTINHGGLLTGFSIIF